VECERGDDDDLHARLEQKPSRGAQSARRPGVRVPAGCGYLDSPRPAAAYPGPAGGVAGRNGKAWNGMGHSAHRRASLRGRMAGSGSVPPLAAY
jgi:hypothetical protein